MSDKQSAPDTANVPALREGEKLVRIHPQDERAGHVLGRYGHNFGPDNFKLFIAGVSRRPEDVAASVRDATGAAAKAIAAGGGGA